MRNNLYHRPVLKCPVDSLLGDLLIENNDNFSIAFSNLACASLTPRMSLEPKREDSGVDSKYLSISPCTIPSFRDGGYLKLLRMRSICLVLSGEPTACRDWRRKSIQIQIQDYLLESLVSVCDLRAYAFIPPNDHVD